MGKAENPSGLLETVEENQNEIPNAESTWFRGLKSQGTSQQQKRLLENGESLEANLFKENNSQAGIYIHARLLSNNL